MPQCPDDDRCEDGYRKVTIGYVDNQAPTITPLIDLPTDPLERAKVEREHAEAVRRRAGERAAAANSVYPCPGCNGELFLRWQAGDWPNPKRRDTPVSADQIREQAAEAERIRSGERG